jgi:UDP-glucose 4-epimerase
VEARELGERFRAQAERVLEYTAKMPLAHAEGIRHGAHWRVGQTSRGSDDEHRRMLRPRGRTRREGAIEHPASLGDIARGVELLAELPCLGLTPQRVEGHDAPCELARGHAEHGLVCAETKPCRDGALPTPDVLPARCVLRAEHVHVEPAMRRCAEARHDLHLRARHGDERHVAIAREGEQRVHRGCRARAWHEWILLHCAVGHDVSVWLASGTSKTRAALVRFFQSCARVRGQALLMKILLTGATGKVGSRLGKRLVQRGHHVRALVRDLTRAHALSEAGIELAEGDLSSASSLERAVLGVQAVVHCAAFFRGATEEEAHAVNDLGTQHLAQAARAAHVQRFVFTSTGLVYGPNGGRPAAEDDACAPVAAYPVSKLAAERFLLALAGLDVTVLRLPFVYGDGDPHIEEVVPMMRTFSPTQRMSVAHHVDVAQAIARLLEAPARSHRIYNLTDDEAPDLATLFASVGEAPPDGSHADQGRVFEAVMDGRRLREDVGFSPEVSRLAPAAKAV